MKIEHFALWTKNLERMREFYDRFFDGRTAEKYTEVNGFESYFITFPEGARLEIMTIPTVEDVSVDHNRQRNGYQHLAFSVGSKEKVDDLTRELRNNGYAVFREPNETGDGYYESCVLDPDGNYLEITA